MTDALRVLMPKPIMGMTAAEREASLDLIKAAIESGKTVVLGGDRCYFCGAELGAPVPDAMRRMGGSGPLKVFIRLCDDCYKLTAKTGQLHE